MDPIKIVVRYRDGRILRGHSQNFFPNRPSFHVLPHDAKNASETVEVYTEQLKAVFFVRDFFGKKDYEERRTASEGDKAKGRILVVTFKDGEVIVGSTTGYDPKRPGFFIFPVDPMWNNMKIYIVSAAVSKVHFL